jgi:hypothetical protein
MGEEDTILTLCAKLRAAIAEDKLRKEEAVRTRAARKESGQMLWVLWRTTINAVERLGGWRTTKYQSWKEFSLHEMNSLHKSIYSAEHTCACYEEKIFEVPICTYPKSFFTNSGLYGKKGVSFVIRRQIYSGKGWEFDEEECDRAKAAWHLAKELAIKSHPENPMPNADDMGLAVGQITGHAYEKPMNNLERSALKIEELQKRIEELSNNSSPRAEAAVSPICDRKRQRKSELEEYRGALKKADQLIGAYCTSPAQKVLAFSALLEQQPENINGFLQTLVARHTRKAG